MRIDIAATDDLGTCLALRHAVFVEEQGVSPVDEQDGRDRQAHHILAHLEDRPVGTARLLLIGETGKIGRVCVLPEARGRGLGAALVEACVAHLRGIDGISRAQLGAQLQALGFYEALGFVAFGPVYDDAGVPHRDMELPL